MKMTSFKIVLTFCLIMFISCDKHLDEKVLKSKDITIKWYRKSEITSVHEFIDLERWGYTDNILEANSEPGINSRQGESQR